MTLPFHAGPSMARFLWMEPEHYTRPDQRLNARPCGATPPIIAG